MIAVDHKGYDACTGLMSTLASVVARRGFTDQWIHHGHVAWVGDDQQDLLTHLPKWFGAPAG